ATAKCLSHSRLDSRTAYQAPSLFPAGLRGPPASAPWAEDPAAGQVPAQRPDKAYRPARGPKAGTACGPAPRAEGPHRGFRGSVPRNSAETTAPPIEDRQASLSVAEAGLEPATQRL